MKALSCEFESEVLAAVMEARWPECAGAELRAHVEECAICRDVAATAAAFEADRETLRAEAALPDAGLVWWRAQLRARREAAKVAGRPIRRRRYWPWPPRRGWRARASGRPRPGFRRCWGGSRWMCGRCRCSR